MAKQLDAKRTGFPDNLVSVWNNMKHYGKDKKKRKVGFEGFKEWYDPKFKNLSAEEVWKSKGGEIPSKK